MSDFLQIFPEADPKLISRFETYHENHPWIFDEFVRLSQEMRGTGKKRYSAWAIINKLRWDFDLINGDKTFGIPNDFIGMYSRLVIWMDSSFSDFFETRPMKGGQNRQVTIEHGELAQ